MASTATPATIGPAEVDEEAFEKNLQAECLHYGVVYIPPGGKSPCRQGTKEVDYGKELTAVQLLCRRGHRNKRRAALQKAVLRAKKSAMEASKAGAGSSSAAAAASSPVGSRSLSGSPSQVPTLAMTMTMIVAVTLMTTLCLTNGTPPPDRSPLAPAITLRCFSLAGIERAAAAAAAAAAAGAAAADRRHQCRSASGDRGASRCDGAAAGAGHSRRHRAARCDSGGAGGGTDFGARGGDAAFGSARSDPGNARACASAVGRVRAGAGAAGACVIGQGVGHARATYVSIRSRGPGSANGRRWSAQRFVYCDMKK